MIPNLDEFLLVRDQVTHAIDSFPTEKRLQKVFGDWSLKDIVAHLSNWMVHDIDCLQALQLGKTPTWEPDVDEFNQRGVKGRMNQPWENVWAEYQELTDKIKASYIQLPENLWYSKIWPNKPYTPATFIEVDIKHWRDEHLPKLLSKSNETLLK